MHAHMIQSAYSIIYAYTIVVMVANYNFVIKNLYYDINIQSMARKMIITAKIVTHLRTGILVRQT
jgi:hypothetical protein